MLLTKPLLRCPGGVFGIIVMLKTQVMFHLQCPLLMEGGFHSKSHDTWPHSFFPLHRSVVLVPLQENQPQSMMFPPPCFTVGMVFFGCNSAFFLLQTRQVEFLPKSSILVSSDHMTFSQSSSGSSKCSLANFRRGLDMYWLKQGDTSGTAGFESLAAQCVTDGSLCYFGLSSLQVIH